MKTPDDALLCPITLELFRDPVLAQDGHTYEREAIKKWIRKNGTSPITNQQISLEHLYPNHAIKKVIDHFETSSREKNFQYTLDVDVKKRKGRPLFQAFGKTIYNAEWLPNNDGRPEVVLLEIQGARANKEASFYVDLSRHPHILRTFGMVHENDDIRNSVMLLQEFASEGSLYEVLRERKNPLDEKILIEMFLQIIDAMSYLAYNHVVHGDLACRNVLVFRFDENDSKNVVVKVTDFGLSRHSKIYTQAASVAKTTLNIIPIRYCAPEILSKDMTANDYTEKSDIYSMGVLMWEAYSRGAIPWNNIENDEDVARHVRNFGTLPQPANCSSHYWAIITKTWDKSPDQRPTFDQLKKLFKEQVYPTAILAPKPEAPSYCKPSDPSPLDHTNKPKAPNLDGPPPICPDNSEQLESPNYYQKTCQYLLDLFRKPEASNPDGTRPMCQDISAQLDPPGYYKPTIPSPADRSNLTRTGVTTGETDIREEIQNMDLVDQWVKFDQQRCQVKGRYRCGDDEIYALESDKPMKGYDGLCPKCRRTHIKFDESHKGLYVSVKNLHEKMYSEKLAGNRLKGRKDINELKSFPDNIPPLDHPILGQNKGIEGDSNSCYMDATIFCMFAYSDVFDSLLHMKTQTKSIGKLQRLLRENIVHLLRSDKGFVERDALFHLRAQLSEATGDLSFKEVEKDPSEFLRALEELFHYAPMKTIAPDQPPNETQSNITTNIIWEMFDANPQNLLSTNIASIFRNSLAEISVKLATIPPLLVLVAPRHARSQRSYRYIIPNRQISLDNNVVQLVCLKCQKTNQGSEKPHDFYSCYECLKDLSLLTSPSTDATITCYCAGCLRELHAELSEFQRLEHSPKQIKVDKHKLNLFAVLCIEKSHYVTFVKCKKQSQQHEWLFFDSTSDRVGGGTNVPLVARVPDFDQWIDQAENDQDFFKKLDEHRNRARPASQTFDEKGMRQLRLFRDGAFFFYENSNVSYQ